MTNAQVKAKFTRTLNKAAKNGFRFTTRYYFIGNCGCAVGAVNGGPVDYKKYSSAEIQCAETIKADLKQVYAVEAGFCGWGDGDHNVIDAKQNHPDLYEFGQQLAKKFLV